MEQKEKAVIVGVKLKANKDFEHSMKECALLAEACGIDVVCNLTQSLQRANTTHYLGKGKVQELSALLKEMDTSTVIFNDELSPTQIRNLESDLGCIVMDRTMLILNIFADRAKTREAKLQVEVAQLQYQLPRLIGQGESLGRQGGGSGLKNRGSGETKLELDHRKIQIRINELNKELEQIALERHIQRRKREKKQMPVVSLVGYTNAGKSTIMNRMLERFNYSSNKQVFEKDMLFATLETSVRQIKLPDNKTFLLSDTVGFVSGLPHHLVKAFRSTLEEVIEADVLIHVVDYSNAQYKKHISVTNETLKSIGADQVPMVYAYNKADLMDAPLPTVVEDGVILSAKENKGLDELIQMIQHHIFNDYIECEMLIPFDQGRLVSYLNENASVQQTHYEGEGTRLLLECKMSDYDKFQEYVIQG